MPREDKDDSGPAEDKPSARGRRLRREDNVEGDKPDAPAKSPSTRDASAKSTPAQPQPEPEAAKPRRRRAEDKQETPAASNEGGWMNGPAPKSAKAQAEAPIEDIQTSKNNKHFQESNAEGEIVMIPDLEEDGGEGDGRVARAPRNTNRRIPTLAELESDAKAAIMISESGLDLSVLLSTLVPPAMVVESDTPWTFESLLRDITDELLPIIAGNGDKQTDFDS